MARQFQLSEKEGEAATAFVREQIALLAEKQRAECPDCAKALKRKKKPSYCHLHICGPYTGAIGGGVQYLFTPTSLGTSCTVRCFGVEKDITDYKSW